MILSEILESAIGSGDDVGSLNLKNLKAVITSIVEKLEIGNSEPSFGSGVTSGSESPATSGNSPDNEKFKNLEDKLNNLGILFERKRSRPGIDRHRAEIRPPGKFRIR